MADGVLAEQLDVDDPVGPGDHPVRLMAPCRLPIARLPLRGVARSRHFRRVGPALGALAGPGLVTKPEHRDDDGPPAWPEP